MPLYIKYSVQSILPSLSIRNLKLLAFYRQENACLFILVEKMQRHSLFRESSLESYKSFLDLSILQIVGEEHDKKTHSQTILGNSIRLNTTTTTQNENKFLGLAC